ncbi:iron-sulfur cluster assembly protein [Carbonactinospora thermoautotrophica]|uniref:iron-sulfur cluster assembly protein n=1 Tax=Carbonactinospora thermoautotrophica TaxID=1469144 RepID=UPI00099E9BD6|nr:iron-sulfur cluster assembly protein [Carbonactinospora thermoautotrophica]
MTGHAPDRGLGNSRRAGPTASRETHRPATEPSPRPDPAAVRAALATVRDPELDEPVTDLGFVAEIRVEGGEVSIRLRLPTYFCAPNFAYLMVADAYDVVSALPGVERVAVRLEDHFAASEINAGVAAGQGFAAAFPALADGELAQVRRVFLRKAFLAATERVCAGVLRDGLSPDALAGLRLGDVPPSPDLDRLRRRRAELGLPDDPDARLLVDTDGRPLHRDEAAAHLRFARVTRVGVDANTALCRTLITTRYAPPGPRTGRTTRQVGGPA